VVDCQAMGEAQDARERVIWRWRNDLEIIPVLNKESNLPGADPAGSSGEIEDDHRLDTSKTAIACSAQDRPGCSHPCRRGGSGPLPPDRLLKP